MKKSTLALALCCITAVVPAIAQSKLSPMQEAAKAAMKSDVRNEADTKRDRNRMPVYALEFFGLKQDMKVLEFAPGNGWYTKVLGPILNEKGQLYVLSADKWLKDLDVFMSKPGFDNIKKLPIDLSWNREERRYNYDQAGYGLTDIDMVLNIREYHNFNVEDKAKINKDAFDALKSGGRYVIVDHTRRHMALETRETGRREDPVKVILEVQAAGFVLEKQ
ncbi:MAG: methyltransferase, partial [Psychrosphaera sp.]|nr:methyltransferase [Psychrosphaera sp.]